MWWMMALALAGKSPVAKATADLTRHDGPWTAWVDDRRVLLELPTDPQGDDPLARLLLASALPHGLGSNPVGLDRGQLGGVRPVHLIDAGATVHVVQHNLAHRALSDDPAERQAVTESFATSTLAALPVVARDTERVLVDLTGFLGTDLHGVARAVGGTGQGELTLDTDRTRVLPASTEGFAHNLAFFTSATFTTADPGPQLHAVAPDPHAVTVQLGQLWIEAPDPGYEPLAYDPRGGTFAVGFADHAAPPAAPLQRAFATRHDPSEPLTYYVDPGAPEPVRSALLDGAGWWAEAFEAAGVPYRVALLPPDHSPYDIDVNVIQWVHRATRGWSYGDAVTDPRTGEILKGHVTLGSQRVRHDRRLFEALLGTEATGTGRADDPEQLALARIRQLAAHEVGHTLGLRHNFAASTADRASVMDYPAPLLRLEGDEVVSRDAYGVGVGPWDRAVVAWAYGDGELAEVMALPYLSDADARPLGAAHPAASLWDNGDDAVAELQRLVSVRAHALQRFGEDRVAEGRPLAELREVFPLVWLVHRYQLTAVSRAVGGVSYRYAVRGEQEPKAKVVPAAAQRDALTALVSLLSVDHLTVPEAATAVLLPPPPGPARRQEHLGAHTDPTFDALAASGALAQRVVDVLLAPERLARVEGQHAVDPDQLGVTELVNRLWNATETDAPGPVRFEARRAVVVGLLRTVRDPAVTPGVRARVDDRLARLGASLSEATDPLDRWLGAQIVRVRSAPAQPTPSPRPALPLPPGSPIGCGR